MKKQTFADYSLAELEAELKREEEKNRLFGSIRSTVSMLLVTAAAVTLLTIYMFPIMRVRGSSMEPTLQTDDVIVAVKGKDLKKGDLMAFYYNNTVIVKRVIALEGDIVDINVNGIVSVNGESLEEDYVYQRSLAPCNITMPYTVPEGKVFVLGDHREVSIDSRTSELGCIARGQIIGRVVTRIWPLWH